MVEDEIFLFRRAKSHEKKIRRGRYDHIPYPGQFVGVRFRIRKEGSRFPGYQYRQNAVPIPPWPFGPRPAIRPERTWKNPFGRLFHTGPETGPSRRLSPLRDLLKTWRPRSGAFRRPPPDRPWHKHSGSAGFLGAGRCDPHWGSPPCWARGVLIRNSMRSRAWAKVTLSIFTPARTTLSAPGGGLLSGDSGLELAMALLRCLVRSHHITGPGPETRPFQKGRGQVR